MADAAMNNRKGRSRDVLRGAIERLNAKSGIHRAMAIAREVWAPAIVNVEQKMNNTTRNVTSPDHAVTRGLADRLFMRLFCLIMYEIFERGHHALFIALFEAPRKSDQ